MSGARKKLGRYIIAAFFLNIFAIMSVGAMCILLVGDMLNNIRQIRIESEHVSKADKINNKIYKTIYAIDKAVINDDNNHLIYARDIMVDVIDELTTFVVERQGAEHDLDELDKLNAVLASLVKFKEEFLPLYSLPGTTEEDLDNMAFFYKQTVLSPARLAGGILLVHETLDQIKEPRMAWLYNPGQRRVRRAPNVAYDNPGTASDGMRTTDQMDMFSGATDRYDWKLVGRKEFYIPYNSYYLHSPELKYKDILTALHPNPEYLRYELHRVWVVDATLRDGARHIYKRRTFYIDEDSWHVMVVDQYDNRDQMWRVSEGHCILYYDTFNFWTTLESHVDLQAGRYIVIGLDNEDQMYRTLDFTKSDFAPSALRREGRR